MPGLVLPPASAALNRRKDASDTTATTFIPNFFDQVVTPRTSSAPKGDTNSTTSKYTTSKSKSSTNAQNRDRGETIRQTRPKTPKFFFKCRYGCTGSTSVKSSASALRTHMVTFHNLTPEGKAFDTCAICARKFDTKGKFESHNNSLCFRPDPHETEKMRAWDAERERWNVIAPRTRQERADTFAFEVDGPPSASVKVKNNNSLATFEALCRMKAAPIPETLSREETMAGDAPLPRKGNKRKATETPPSSSGPTSDSDDVIEILSRPLKRPALSVPEPTFQANSAATMPSNLMQASAVFALPNNGVHASAGPAISSPVAPADSHPAIPISGLYDDTPNMSGRLRTLADRPGTQMHGQPSYQPNVGVNLREIETQQAHSRNSGHSISGLEASARPPTISAGKCRSARANEELPPTLLAEKAFWTNYYHAYDQHHEQLAKLQSRQRIPNMQGHVQTFGAPGWSPGNTFATAQPQQQQMMFQQQQQQQVPMLHPQQPTLAQQRQSLWISQRRAALLMRHQGKPFTTDNATVRGVPEVYFTTEATPFAGSASNKRSQSDASFDSGYYS